MCDCSWCVGVIWSAYYWAFQAPTHWLSSWVTEKGLKPQPKYFPRVSTSQCPSSALYWQSLTLTAGKRSLQSEERLVAAPLDKWSLRRKGTSPLKVWELELTWRNWLLLDMDYQSAEGWGVRQGRLHMSTLPFFILLRRYVRCFMYIASTPHKNQELSIISYIIQLRGLRLRDVK